jgi:hypothetical protein
MGLPVRVWRGRRPRGWAVTGGLEEMALRRMQMKAGKLGVCEIRKLVAVPLDD